MNGIGRILIFGYGVISLLWAILSNDSWPIRLLLFVLAVIYLVMGTKYELDARRTRE